MVVRDRLNGMRHVSGVCLLSLLCVTRAIATGWRWVERQSGGVRRAQMRRFGILLLCASFVPQGASAPAAQAATVNSQGCQPLDSSPHKKRAAKRWQSFQCRWSLPLTTIDDRASLCGSVQATRNLGATADELASSRWTLAVQCLVVPALRTVQHALNHVRQTLADKPPVPP